MDIGVGLSRTVADDALRRDVYTQATWFISEFACLYAILLHPMMKWPFYADKAKADTIAT